MHPFYGPTSQLLADGSSSWLGLVSMAMYLLFWAVVVVIAIRLLKKHILPLLRSQSRPDNAMAILRERYARGEIDAEEFKRKKADLQ